MDVQDWLQTITGDCTLLSEPEETISLLPSVGVDGPPLVELRLSESGSFKGFPSACADRLRPPIGKLVARELAGWKQGEAPDALSLSRPELLVEDELVAVVTELIAEACAYDRRLASGVMLEVARESAALISGQIEEWGGRAEVINLPRLVSELSEAPLPSQASAYQALTWALTSRLSAAWALAAQLDDTISPTRFYQAMVVNKLVFTHPAGSLGARDLGLIAALHGVEIEPERLGSAYLAVVAVLQRLLAGGDDALSRSLRDLIGGRTDPAALALDPVLSAAILNRLDDLIDHKALKDAGISKRDLKSLQKGSGVAAVSAAYTRCASAMRSWDLLSAAAGRSLALRFKGVSAESRLGRLESSAAWGLLVPRGGGGVVNSTVVALDFSALNHFVATRADRTRGLTLGLAAYREKLARTASRLEGVGGRASGFELFAFTHPGSAESFLSQVRDTLSAIHLDRGPFGRPTPVASDIWIRSSVASGEIMGGWDGSSLQIWGPAVDEACRGAAGGRASAESSAASEGSFEGVGSLLSKPAVATQPAGEASPPPADPFSTMGDPFSKEIPNTAPEQDRAPPGGGDDPFASMEVDDDEGELFGAGDTFIIEAPEDSSEEEDPDFDNPFDDEARTVLTTADTFRASGNNQDQLDEEAPEEEPVDDEQSWDEESEPGEAVLVGFEDEALEEDSSEPGEAVLVDEELAEPEHTLEIVDDEGSEYEYVMDDDSEDSSEDPNTDLDGYFLPGEVASPESLQALEDEEPELSLTPPDDDPSQDEITFNVPLSRDVVEEDVGDSRTFDFELPSEPASTFNLADPEESLGESDSDPSSEAILSLDEGPLDLPGEPLDDGPPSEIQDFVLDDLESDSSEDGASTGGGLSWLEQVEEPLEPEPSEDSYSGVAALPDLEYLFQGYVVFSEGEGTIFFGRKYGKRLLDVHSYDVEGKLGSAYQSFLNDKVSEGFVPRADLTRSMPRDTDVDTVDLEEMGRAFRVLAAR